MTAHKTHAHTKYVGDVVKHKVQKDLWIVQEKTPDRKFRLRSQTTPTLSKIVAPHILDEDYTVSKFTGKAGWDKIPDDFNANSYVSDYDDKKDDPKKWTLSSPQKEEDYKGEMPLGTKLKRITYLGTTYVCIGYDENAKKYALWSTTSSFVSWETKEYIQDNFTLYVKKPPIAVPYTKKELEALHV